MTPATQEVAGGPGRSHGGAPRVSVGLAATPGIAASVAESVRRDLVDELAILYPEARWEVRAVNHGPLTGPMSIGDVVDTARKQLLAHGCVLLVLLTDLPLGDGRRPVLTHVSPVHGVGVVSLPALGAVQLRSKARRAVMTAIDALLGMPPAVDGRSGRRREFGRRVRQLARDVEAPHGGVAFVARVITGNLHLLAGMVRANRPWRLTLGLQRALTGALAGVVFAVITSDIWLLSDRLGWSRLAVASVAAIATIDVTLIVGAGLWERSGNREVRQQVMLFNLATAATLVIGVAALGAALFAITVVSAALMVPGELLGEVLGHDVSVVDRAELAWLCSVMGLLAGALGAGLETDEAVRQAAYVNRHRRAPGLRPVDPVEEVAREPERDVVEGEPGPST